MAKPVSRARTASRVAAVQALYQIEQNGDAPEAVILQFQRHRLVGGSSPDNSFEEGCVPDAEGKLFGQIVRAATRRIADLDALIEPVLPAEWPLARLDPVLLALLRAGVAELSMPDGPPGRVVINEYLDVAYGFFHGDEPRMANGILDRLARQLRPNDFANPVAS